ncbi:UNVERIFIED_CONTAM: hypothetical protein HDU68_012338 [Siphonaria sp. JEL0065]|nr:hypothetical protein HDU68_012338 [Siphonaria sp. JEL0065]
MSNIGPSLPPGFGGSNKEEEQEEQESNIGPALPPGFVKRGPAAKGKEKEQEPEKKRRRVMGPAAPPPPSSFSNFNNDNDNDDVGPLPIPEEYSEYLNNLDIERKRLEIEARVSGNSVKNDDGSSDSNSAPSRGAWMLVPPEVKKLNDVLGTELKHRQFSRSAKEDKIDQSGWTRLPGERATGFDTGEDSQDFEKKRKLVELEVSATALSQHELDAQRAVEEYNKANRPKSLMEMHTKEYVNSSKFAENDASSRKFDRDRDLSSRRTDGKARQNLIDGAQKLDSRFSRGK